MRASENEHALLRAYGHSDKQIAAMNQAQRAAELADAMAAGVDSSPQTFAGDERSGGAKFADSEARSTRRSSYLPWFVGGVLILVGWLGYGSWPEPGASTRR